ncbi:hypothetical protein L479_01218 [Exiguobacterium sp. S17]|nr:hypothetical protein L479_01218 [Exiguobacterium sp. S17]
MSNARVSNIVLSNNLSTNINATRKVNINLNGKTLTGNVSFATTEPGEIRLGAGQITGNLTVNTPNISFYNAATVNGTTTITDVANNTFTNNGVLKGAVNLNDANGARFVNRGTLDNGLNINTSATIKLDGTFAQVTLEGTGKVVLDGTIQTLNAEQDVVIEGGSVEEVKGDGGVMLESDAPKVSIKDYVTYQVSGTVNEISYKFQGVQARVLLTPQELSKTKSGDKVIVTLLAGNKALVKSTSDNELDKMFINEFADEKFYASTMFLPNGQYPSKSWVTEEWTTPVKPDGLKVEIVRGEKVIYSVVSSKPLNESFTDGSSTEILSWEDVLEFNAKK